MYYSEYYVYMIMNKALQIFNLLVIVCIFQFLNNMYLSSDTFLFDISSHGVFFNEKSLCHQLVFRPEFFPFFAWVYDNIRYGLQHIRLYFFSCDDLFNFFLYFFQLFLVVLLWWCVFALLCQVVDPVFPLFNLEAVYSLLALCMHLFYVEQCSTLFLLIPQPVQYTALFLRFGVSLVMSPIVFAQLMATKSIPGCCCSVLMCPGLMIKCWNWSFLSNPASKPWNLCILVAQLGTSGQNVTKQHPCFILHHFVFIGMGTCLIVEIIQ